ncbi:MAG TPA: M50 family metallopeptidase [Candidatus Limiplasma sp.]|nr:M50 family metallopeptidase [Candidatus Limiplasma sp.]
MTIFFILLAILLLAVLIVAHEWGHYMSARALKIAVKEFSIGFGPKLTQWKSKKRETVFSLRGIPLGGYCAFYDEDTETLSKDDPRRFMAAAVWKRMIVVLAGSVMNILLAFVLAIVLHLAYGYVAAQPSIAAVTDGSPAAQAGLLAGDELMAADDTPITIGDASGLSAVVDTLAAGDTMTLTVARGGQELTVDVTPQYDEDEGRSLIGVSIIAYARPTFTQAVSGAWDSCVYASTAIAQALGNLIFHGEGAEDVTGPVGVVQVIAEQTQSGGLYMYLSLAILIAINLGIVNLLPIPGLDGSRFLFLVAEAIRRKPVNRRVEGTIHMIGFVILFGLMILFTFRDIERLFGG